MPTRSAATTGTLTALHFARHVAVDANASADRGVAHGKFHTLNLRLLFSDLNKVGQTNMRQNECSRSCPCMLTDTLNYSVGLGLFPAHRNEILLLPLQSPEAPVWRKIEIDFPI